MIYADPGSGVLIWQLLLAIFFGAAFYFSKLRHWATAKLRSRHHDFQQGISEVAASKSLDTKD